MGVPTEYSTKCRASIHPSLPSILRNRPTTTALLPLNAMISPTIEINAPPSKVRSVVGYTQTSPHPPFLPYLSSRILGNHLPSLHSSSTSPTSTPTTRASSKPSNPSTRPTRTRPPSPRVRSCSARLARRSSLQSRKTRPTASSGKGPPNYGLWSGVHTFTFEDSKVARGGARHWCRGRSFGASCFGR